MHFFKVPNRWNFVAGSCFDAKVDQCSVQFNSTELLIEIFQRLIDHGADPSQWVVSRHTRLGADGAEQGVLLNIRAAHSVCVRRRQDGVMFALASRISTGLSQGRQE